MTGASVTNKGASICSNSTPRRSRCRDILFIEFCPTGIYYEPGKEPPAEGPPKLHLLIESNEEWRVSGAHLEYQNETDGV